MILDRGSRRPVVIAHRGAWSSEISQNSLASFERAVRLGADMIEFDVRRTGDDQLVIFHDHEVAGLPVSELTRADLAAQVGELPPLLEEALEFAENRIGLAVELKEDGWVERAAPLLSGLAATGTGLLVISFLDSALAQLEALAPQLHRGLLLEHSADGARERARACGAATVLPKTDLADDALLADLAASSLSVVLWDFLAAEHADLLADPRVDGVITDDVPGALEARDRLAARNRFAAPYEP